MSAPHYKPISLIIIIIFINGICTCICGLTCVCGDDTAHNNPISTTTDMEFVKNFTPSDFQAKNFTLSISPNFNSFSKKKHKKWVKLEKITLLAKILHCCRHWRHWQIPPLHHYKTILIHFITEKSIKLIMHHQNLLPPPHHPIDPHQPDHHFSHQHGHSSSSSSLSSSSSPAWSGDWSSVECGLHRRELWVQTPSIAKLNWLRHLIITFIIHYYLISLFLPPHHCHYYSKLTFLHLEIFMTTVLCKILAWAANNILFNNNWSKILQCAFTIWLRPYSSS